MDRKTDKRETREKKNARNIYSWTGRHTHTTEVSVGH